MAVEGGGGFFVMGLSQISSSFSCENKTNYPISSNSHPSATANKAIHSLKNNYRLCIALLVVAEGWLLFDIG